MEENKPKVGLWKKESKAGDAYWSGNDEKMSYKIFTNKYKTKPNQPDFQMYIEPRKEHGTPPTDTTRPAVQYRQEPEADLPF